MLPLTLVGGLGNLGKNTPQSCQITPPGSLLTLFHAKNDLSLKMVFSETIIVHELIAQCYGLKVHVWF